LGATLGFAAKMPPYFTAVCRALRPQPHACIGIPVMQHKVNRVVLSTAQRMPRARTLAAANTGGGDGHPEEFPIVESRKPNGPRQRAI